MLLDAVRDFRLEIGPLKKAKRFSSHNPQHLQEASELISKGKVGVMAFNGVYGIFGDIDRFDVSQRIMEVKDRPEDKKLILTSAPEYLHEHVNLVNLPYSHEQIMSLQKKLHALGVILPASMNAAKHVVSDKNTVLSIWTEYAPIRTIIENLRGKNVRALVGTSANKSGHPTFTEAEAVFNEFKRDVDFILEDDFSSLPEIRRRSTSVIDLTKERPRLHRLGNVSEDEIKEGLMEFGFPELVIEEDRLIKVNTGK